MIPLLLWGCQPAPPPHVLLVTLDTTRADALGAYGGPPGLTPHLDALAADGATFTRVMATQPLTAPAHGSLLTGLYPDRHGIRGNGAYALADVPTLAERLSAAGWVTEAYVSASVLHHDVGLARGFAVYDDAVAPLAPGQPRRMVPERDGADTVQRALTSFVERTDDRPRFLWVHLYDAHTPYVPDAPRHPDPYLAEVGEVDAHVGRLLDGLRTASDRPWLVVAVADHGEGRGDHGEATHGFFVYQSTLHVPLIVAGPGVPAGVTVDAPASQVDVTPTLLGLLGLPPGDADGVDLRTTFTGSAPDRIVYGESLNSMEAYGLAPLFVTRDATWRTIHAPRPERYRWTEDPGERLDRIGEALDLSADRRWMADRPGAGRAPTERTTEALEALGYLVAEPGGLDPDLQADPKDHPTLPADVEAVVDAAHRLPPTRGAALLSAFQERHPGIPQLVDELSMAWEAAGDLERALRELEVYGDDPRREVRARRAWLRLQLGDHAALADLEALLAAHPDRLELRMALAAGQRFTGDAAAALATLEGRPAPEGHHDYEQLHGTLLLGVGRRRDAAAAFRRALVLDPDNRDTLRLLAPTLAGLGWTEEAVLVTQRARRLDPAADWALALEGRIAEAQGGCAAAEPLLAELAALPSPGEEARSLLADCNR